MAEARPRVLVALPGTEGPRALAGFLGAQGFECVTVRDTESALNALERDPVTGLVCAARGPRLDGLAILDRARAREGSLCAVVVATHETRALALEAVRRGAYDFQVEPLDRDKLLATLRLGLGHQRLARRVVEMEGRLDRRSGLRALTGRSRAIQRVRDQVQRLAATRAPVLLEGEPGSGKSIVARALHQLGPRRERRFERVRLGALAEELLGTELFGSEAAGVPGAVERTDGGTLFLDEADRAPLSVQVRLLRLLQERAFERAGGTRTRRADVRLVAACDGELARRVRAGAFREDLYDALAATRVQLPPLRERRDDLPLLVEELVRVANREHGRRVPGVTMGVLDRLARHDWPGNVSELRNVVDGMVSTARGRRPLDVESLPAALRADAGPPSTLGLSVGMTLEAAERRLVEATLAHTRGDKRRAAAMLGLSLRTLYRRLEAWGDRPPRRRQARGAAGQGGRRGGR
jgi:DNA-binding NtrC family response regulator